MAVQTETILKKVAQELHVSEEDLVRHGLRSFLEAQLREVKAEIFKITGFYGVSNVEEMDARYREGTLEEAESWQDLQHLDHLEHKRETLLQLIETLG